MIRYVIDNLKITDDDNIFIIYYDMINQIENILKDYKIKYISLDHQTKGAAETIMFGLENIIGKTKNNKCVILDCNAFYTQDILSYYRNCDNNACFYIDNKDIEPIYSYIKINDNIIVDIKEKIKISDNANTGIYAFNNINILYDYCKKVINNCIYHNKELYVSYVINEMIIDGHKFNGIMLDKDKVFNLGTPKHVKKYIDNTYGFLFDLDGTIVITDKLYYSVWENILNEYNFKLSDNIYNEIINGNDDNTVIKKIFSNVNIDVNKITEKKINLFIKNIDRICVVEGIIEFMKKIKSYGHKIAIVTNCNRIIAETIIKKIRIYDFIDKLIIGSECNRPKPYPDPYRLAIENICVAYKKCVIFEDSKSGIISGKACNPHCLVGISSNMSKEILMQYGANICIDNFNDIDIDKLIDNKHNNDENDNLIKIIKKSINFADSIQINDTKLKGGFISDVISIKINNKNYVIKLENNNKTFLQKMAGDLDLYEREYYFYDNISKYVPVKFPKFIGLINNGDKNIGFIAENLFSKGYTNNLDLNNISIDVTLNIIDALSELHASFWGKKIQDFFPKLKKHNDALFCPKLEEFVKTKWQIFKTKWENMMTMKQIEICENIVENFGNIQNYLSNANLTLCHGDVKSPNIFYKKIKNNFIPYFIDWQYISIGKGVQTQ